MIFCSKAIQEIKLYPRREVGDFKGSYYRTIIYPFQGLCQGNVGLPSGWFLISFILILYLKVKIQGAKIKTSITGGDFNLVSMMFFSDRYFETLGGRTNSQLVELLKKHQRTVDE